jgi:hypothetical protein
MRFAHFLQRLLPALLLSGLTTAVALEDYARLEFQLPGNTEQLLIADIDGDGRRDLLTVGANELRVYFQQSDGFDFRSGYQSLTLPGAAVGWTLSDGFGGNALALVALVDGREVLLWRILEQSITEPEVLLDNLSGFLPRGVNRLHFAQDINEDGYDDLIVPGAGTLDLHISDANGGYQAGITVQTEVQMETVLATGRLERQAGQAITIPLMEIRDLNADGAADLISRTEERLDVFLARPGSNTPYFDTAPTFSLDIAAIEDSLGEFDLDRLDFSNLTGILALTHEELLEDVNADGIDDLLLREGGKVSLFMGTPTGINLEQPVQVLRSGGNVLSVFLYDENEDGLKDLWLWRVESISVGDIFLWLALSGDVAVEAFIYPNEGERFARRPSRRITVNLRFPSALRLASQAMDIAREARQSGEQPIPPHVLADLDATPDRQDLVVLAGNTLEIFFNVLEPVTRTDPFLDGLGYRRDRDQYEIDLREVINTISINESEGLEMVQGRPADQQLQISGAITAGDVIAAELNGDGLEDIFVFTRRDDVQIAGILLLSKGRLAE